MIEGMDILHKTEIMRLSALGIAFITIGVIIAVLVVIWSHKRGSFIIALLAFGLTLYGVFQQEGTGRYQYWCTFGEETTREEVESQYNILQIRGRLWEIEDKKE